jgi:hypothetical protein
MKFKNETGLVSSILGDCPVIKSSVTLLSVDCVAEPYHFMRSRSHTYYMLKVESHLWDYGMLNKDMTRLVPVVIPCYFVKYSFVSLVFPFGDWFIVISI